MAGNRYDGLSWSKESIKAEIWKSALGGGAEKWETRGRFQVKLLEQLGLRPYHKFLDFGCGPLRAGKYFIGYLDAGCYHGYDFNEDFIGIGRNLIGSTPTLSEKTPDVFSTQDKDWTEASYDYVLLFSVLNHFQSQEERNVFLRKLEELRKGTRVYITHARWMTTEQEFHNLSLSQRLLTPDDLPQDLNPVKWGWPNREEIFPILELVR